MRRRLAVVAARTVRAVRGLWPDRNPLRRGLDRAEALIVGGLAMAFLAGAPLAALTAGHIADQTATRVVRAERSWHQVPAVLLQTAPEVAGVSTRASWTGPDGVRHTGLVAAVPGTKKGSTVPVWIDAHGRLTWPPLIRSQIVAQTVLAAMLAPLALGFALLGIGLIAHGALGRRRLAAWAADWRVTEPRWTRRHRAS